MLDGLGGDGFSGRASARECVMNVWLCVIMCVSVGGLVGWLVNSPSPTLCLPPSGTALIKP